MNELITKIATKHQRQMSSVHPLEIRVVIEEAIEEALNNEELVKNWNKPAVSNLMPELEKIISSRIKDAFDNGMQNYEKNEIQAALDTIKRLVPPSYFEGICC